MRYHDNRYFRNGLANFYGDRCIISGLNTNQKNHIIPRSFSVHYQKYKYLATDCNNGTCLTPTLHTEYDNYYWDFDVYRAKLNEDGLTCMVPIAISTLSNIRSRRLMIMEYRDQWVTVNVNTLPYLWVHYQVFLSVNYHRITEPNLEYQFWLESSYFQNLCQRPLQVLHQVSNNLSEFVQHEPLIIIKMRGFGTEFLVISRNHAFTEQHWFKNIDLDENLVNRYQSELADD
jgi:hypothetical protein